MSSQEFRIEEAYQSGLKDLYHYEPFRPDYLASMLRNQKIHCSNPDHFNDPWDCKPWFDTSCVDDLEEFGRVTEWFRGISSGKLSTDEVNLLLLSLQADRDDRVSYLKHISMFIAEAFSSHRIYCLTRWNNHQLMWSHYADHHRGVCLQFGTNNLLFGLAKKVRYSIEYPLWAPHVQMTEGRILEMVLTKSAAWSYEDEWRILGASENNPHKDSYFVPEADFFRLPPTSLKSIIAGCASDFEKIKKIVNDNAPGLPVKQAIRIPDKYDLKIEDR